MDITHQKLVLMCQVVRCGFDADYWINGVLMHEYQAYTTGYIRKLTHFVIPADMDTQHGRQMALYNELTEGGTRFGK